MAVNPSERAKRTNRRAPQIGEVGLGRQSSSFEQVAAQDILQDALHNQLASMSSGRFEAFANISGDAFLNTFVQDPLFLDIYGLAQKEALSIPDDEEFGRRLRGAMFEKMAFAYLSSYQGSAVAIMGEDVIDTLHALNPKLPIIDSGFGQKGIAGLYVPDGFVVSGDGSPRVVGVIECSLGRWDKKVTKDKQLYGFCRLTEDLGQLAQNPKFHIVSPTFRELGKLSKNKSEIELIPERVPVTQRAFMSDFMPFIVGNLRGANGKTLADLRQDWHQSPVGVRHSLGEPGFFRK